jgi:uncharacterized integral membrane protein
MSFKIARRHIVRLIAALAIFIFLIVFAVQNFHAGARVHLLFWQTARISLSIIIFISVLIGVGISSAELLPRVIKYRKKAQDAEARLGRLKPLQRQEQQ